MITDCLDSVSFCDEVIVIDNDSTDNTAALAKKAKAKVISYTSHNFSDLRNEGLREASTEWIFYIDADERVSKELRESIKLAIQSHEFSACKMQKKSF